MKILLFLLACKVFSLDCPVFFCYEWVTDACLLVENNVAAYSSCKLPNTFCPDFTYEQSGDVFCINGDEEVEKEIVCYKYAEVGEDCNGKACRSGLYCDGYCKETMGKGEICNGNCGKGLICNFSVCIEYFSLSPGEPSETSIACTSGRLLNNICLSPDKSLKLPQKCETDLDCLGTDGETSTCKCIKKSKPVSYCTYHKSDEIVIEAIKASIDGDINLYQQLWHEVNNYPVLQYSSHCNENDSVELKLQKTYSDQVQFCMAQVVFFITILNLF